MTLHRHRRRIAGLLLVWLGLLQFPLPVPVRASRSGDSGKDRSVAFPCMDRACGCQSAEDCWKSCCCTTKAERIAYVKKLGIAMPDALRDADENPAPRACCSKPATTECPAGSTCDKCEAKPWKPKKGVVLLTSMLKCKGLSAAWSLFSATVVSRPAPVLRLVHVEFGCVTLADDLACGIESTPPVPPPRLGA
jgi:hypothetical protein